MNKNQKLWQTATRFIPGGNCMVSKRPNRYAPDLWPTYFSKSQGVKIWDIDDNEFIDMSQMGYGTAILGYNDPDVNQAVKTVIERGVNTTLNDPNEVILAERLIKLNPGLDKVRFARTGAEAMSIAIRLARAYTGKDKIAFCGYHGWSDWYLAANLKDSDNLANHLLSGLNPKGVPKGLTDTAFPFRFNHSEELFDIVRQHDIGTIVLESARYDYPDHTFLSQLKGICSFQGIVLIADEITSGWRITDGGVYKRYAFQPDIVVYGKAMGNGYAISAVIGKSRCMNQAEETFISSTFWTEGIGFAAALATIDKLIKNKVWEHLNNMGFLIIKGWMQYASECGLKIHTNKFYPLAHFEFDYDDLNPALNTLFTQEMLKKGYLADNSVYVSYAHTSGIISDYFMSVIEVFKTIAQAIKNNQVNQKLETRVRDSGFGRLI